jgi:phage I-like protein
MEARALNAEKTVEVASETTREAEITRVLNEAVTAGKVAPASKDFFLATCRAEGGLERFKTFVANAPSLFGTFDFGEKSSANKPQTALNAEERQILAHTNLTESEYLAAKAAGAPEF